MSEGHQRHADHPTTVALQRRLTSPHPLPAADWQAALERRVAAVADGCEKAGACVIGHIKAFTELPDGYARASAVDTKHAPTSDARASAPTAAADLTMNVLVYGLPAEAAKHIAEDSLARVSASERITISTIGEERDQG